MTDKPKWMMKAVRKIVEALSKEILCYGTADKTPPTKAETTALRIIKEHYPDNKGAELLLEACKEFVRKVECGEARSRRSYAQMKAALAEYEELNK